MTTTTEIATRELDRRCSDGIDVALLWEPATERVLVTVVEREGTSFSLEVCPADALDAFRHPYVYAVDRCGDELLSGTADA